MQLSQLTIDELEHKLTVADETVDDEPSWQPTVDALRRFLEAPTVEALRGNKLVQDELENAVSCCYDGGWRCVKPMVVDLARSGYYDGVGQTMSGRKIKERMIDGRNIPVGY